MTEELFGLAFGLAFGLLTIYMVVQLLKSKTAKSKIRNGFFVLVGLGFTGVGVWLYDISHQLRTSGDLVVGTTIGFCKTGKNLAHKGIEFEYYYNGRQFSACNGFDGNALVPNGKYWVTVSSKHPDIGRIDFNNPVKE